MRRIEDRRRRGSLFARKNASFTTAVTVDERGDGDMNVRDRWWVPGLLGLIVGRGGGCPPDAKGSLKGVAG